MSQNDRERYGSRVARLTDKQDRLLGALDDAVQHVFYEFDADRWRGPATAGFARIHVPDGRCSFIQTLRGLAESDATPNVVDHDRRSGYHVTDLGVDFQVAPRHDSGYRVSITNTSDLVTGSAYQRIDVAERLHELLLERLRGDWGYLEDATVRSRMD